MVASKDMDLVGGGGQSRLGCCIVVFQDCPKLGEEGKGTHLAQGSSITRVSTLD